MSALHTPGPWFTFANGTCVGGPVGILGNPSGAETAGIAHCGMALRTGDELQANARLIAAAPDLLEALETLTGHCRRMGFDTREEEPLLQAAEAAMAKATGAAA